MDRSQRMKLVECSPVGTPAPHHASSIIAVAPPASMPAWIPEPSCPAGAAVHPGRPWYFSLQAVFLANPPAASITPRRARTRRDLPSCSMTAPTTRPSSTISSESGDDSHTGTSFFCATHISPPARAGPIPRACIPATPSRIRRRTRRTPRMNPLIDDQARESSHTSSLRMAAGSPSAIRDCFWKPPNLRILNQRNSTTRPTRAPGRSG